MPDIFVSEHKNQEPVEDKNKTELKVAAAKPYDVPGSSGATVHLFSSYCEDPNDITFENQDEDEKVLLFIRKDLITNFPWLAMGIVLILFPFLAVPIFSFMNFSPITLSQNYLFVITVFYYLIIATFLFINFITWYFNIDIVTEKRVVDIDFEGIVYKNIAATKISLVQDVSYSQVGVVRTIFDYGDVLVQTAGTIDNFIFEAVPRPEDAVHVVENLIGKRHE